MSHCVVLAIVPATINTNGQAEKLIEKMFGPYSEELDVPAYQKDCYCVGNNASNAKHLFMNPLVEAMRKNYDKELQKLCAKYGVKEFSHFSEGMDERLTAEADELWKILLEPIEKEANEFEKKHPDYGKANPACNECKGTGSHESTCNPQGWWDWYCIGGRWAGYLPTKQDICTIEELLAFKEKNWIPYAIVTPDGKWHQKGEMHMFGMSDDKMTDEEWGTEVIRLCKESKDCKIVVVDIHT